MQVNDISNTKSIANIIANIIVIMASTIMTMTTTTVVPDVVDVLTG